MHGKMSSKIVAANEKGGRTRNNFNNNILMLSEQIKKENLREHVRPHGIDWDC